MGEIYDLWAAAVPSRRQPATIASSNALVVYTGAFRNRQSRFETRWLRRYGDYLFDVPLVLLWNDVDYDWSGGNGDLWDY